MRKLLPLLFLFTACATSTTAPVFQTSGNAELWMRGVVSTEASEVRMTISPDGSRMLWGRLQFEGGPGGWEVVESVRTNGTWSAPHAVSFDSSANDFDPSFAPDGSGVYFFSNREGGFGKDDLYFAPFDRAAGMYGAAKNLGANINSAGDEWAPVVSPDGQYLMFATDGRGGKGKHDLFRAQRTSDGWGAPENLEAINTENEDFDATFLDDGRSIILTSGDFDGAINLYFAAFHDGRYEKPQMLGPEVNSKEPDAWTFGPAIAMGDRGALYFTSHHAVNAGRADIYRIGYKLQR